MPGIKQLEGKSFVIKSNGKSRVIGKITGALMSPERQGLLVTIEMTDEEAAGILGAAQDKSEAAESPIGMSEAEIDAAIANAREDLGADPGPFTQPMALHLDPLADSVLRASGDPQEGR